MIVFLLGMYIGFSFILWLFTIKLIISDERDILEGIYYKSSKVLIIIGLFIPFITPIFCMFSVISKVLKEY